MPDISLPISNGNLLEGACFANEQERLNAFVQATFVTFPFNYAVYNVGSTAPTADNRLYPWFRFNMDGTPDKWYAYVNGFWISPNPTQALSPIRLFYLASVGSIDTYDGGEAGSVTSITGPMWERDTDMNGRMALGVNGDYPLNSTGGAASITQTTSQMPAHTHWTVNRVMCSESGASVRNSTLYGVGGDAPRTNSEVQTTEVGASEAMNILNPYKAGFWIKRTARQFYRL